MITSGPSLLQFETPMLFDHGTPRTANNSILSESIFIRRVVANEAGCTVVEGRGPQFLCHLLANGTGFLSKTPCAEMPYFLSREFPTKSCNNTMVNHLYSLNEIECTINGVRGSHIMCHLLSKDTGALSKTSCVEMPYLSMREFYIKSYIYRMINHFGSSIEMEIINNGIRGFLALCNLLLISTDAIKPITPCVELSYQLEKEASIKSGTTESVVERSDDDKLDYDVERNSFWRCDSRANFDLMIIGADALIITSRMKLSHGMSSDNSCRLRGFDLLLSLSMGWVCFFVHVLLCVLLYCELSFKILEI